MEQNQTKIDIVALAEQISTRKDAFHKTKFFNKKAKKSERASINLLINRYNHLVGFKSVNPL